MKTGAGKACQAEIVSYLMTQVIEAPPIKRETLFIAVKSALNVWIAGGRDMRTQAARNALEAGFGGQVREHLARLSQHSTRSPEWLRHFKAFKAAFDQEARTTLSDDVEC
jgi:hypothetical protein